MTQTEERLQKALANAGIASRRACEILITRGRVRVNGRIVTELGTRINTETDEVRVDNTVVQLDVAKRYFVLNKPTGVVSTMSDDQGRRDLSEYGAEIGERLYNVGRLDTDTSGLLIMTNDGSLAHKLAHPSFGVEKTYVAKVRGLVVPGTVKKLLHGFELDDGYIQADAAKVLPGSNRDFSLIELTLHSGRNRIVRRMLAAVGHPVVALVRRQFGPLHLGSLALGQMRELSTGERNALLTAAETDTKTKRPVTAGRPGDGAGARGLRGVAKPKPLRQKAAKRVTNKKASNAHKKGVRK
nr:pseudouridine synthase [Canibacter zhoujuaniae]